jgi:oxalate decarboxylase/phosphoglucose isomerase-like protein (cupin superfamily)
MIDLTEISGLPIKYDEVKARILGDENVVYEQDVFISLNDMTPILLNKSLKYPEKVYKYHRNVYFRDSSSNSPLTYDIIYLPFGLLGIEFIKTHVFYSDYVEGKYDSVVEVLAGNLTVMIQKNREKDSDFDTETFVDEITIITLKKGERLCIPTGVYYTFVNTGIVPVVFSNITGHPHRSTDYNLLRKEKGLAYFLISKNAKVEVVANPKYKIECKMKISSMKRLMADVDCKYVYNRVREVKKPLFTMLIEDLLNDAIPVY